MKAYDLKPTYENLLNTFLNDSIDRRNDIFRFIEILNEIEGSFSIALDGNWGSGKTFFIKQTKMVIDACNNFTKIDCEADRERIVSSCLNFYGDKASELRLQACVYYDAWQNDNDDDPVLSLIYTILNSVNTGYDLNEYSLFKCAANIIEFFTGKDWNKIVEGFRGNDPLNIIKSNKNLETLINDFLNKLLPENGERLIIFIDELDRCKPNYAVRLLERIKHYFENDKITFVFSINSNELQHTIKKHYGNEFNASKYLDRFFDLRITLPPPNMQKFYNSLNFNDKDNTYNIVCGAVIRTYNFELRTIAKYLRMCKNVYNPTNNNYSFYFSDGKALQFCLLYMVPIILGLKISDINRYRDFINGKDYFPLMEVSKMIDPYLFKYFFSENGEKNDVEIEDKLENKFKEVYEAIFINDYRNNSKNIGIMNFNYDCKKMIFEIISLMSKYTDIKEG